MQITNCFEVPFLLFIVSIQVALPSDLSLAYTMGFVPVQFGRSDLPVRKLNACDALEFAPATFAVRFLKPSQITNGRFDGDSLMFVISPITSNSTCPESLEIGTAEVRASG